MNSQLITSFTERTKRIRKQILATGCIYTAVASKEETWNSQFCYISFLFNFIIHVKKCPALSRRSSGYARHGHYVLEDGYNRIILSEVDNLVSFSVNMPQLALLLSIEASANEL